MAGGYSKRMQQDKGLINYHGKPQRTYVYELLEEICDDVFMSIRKNQQSQFAPHIKTIVDENKYEGPFNGLLSAHNFDSEAAWLVLACDLPLMDAVNLKRLKEARDKSKVATVFAAEKTNLPEPLCAIWEPNGLRAAMRFIAEENSFSPVKFLLNNDAKIVNPTQDAVLLNANTEDDRKKAIEKLRKK